MANETEVEQLNSVQYLYLRELWEPRDNSLKIVVEEAVINRSGLVEPELLQRPELAAIMVGASSIDSVEGCAIFELFWRRYATYLVTEELVGANAEKGYDDELYTGRLLRTYSQSHFLAHLVRDTGGHVEPLLPKKPGVALKPLRRA